MKGKSRPQTETARAAKAEVVSITWRTQVQILPPEFELATTRFTMDYKASHRFADMNARKIRQFTALILGMAADEAIETLRFYPNKAARLLEQVVKSAMGNAEDRGARAKEELVVVES